MPKLSLNPKDATKGGGFGALEGHWEIGKAYSTVYQFPASKEMEARNEEYPPSCQVVLELYKLDPKSMDRIDDDPIYERLGFGGKNTLEYVRPGQMKNPTDEDPYDLGREIGVEGNTVCCEVGTTLADNCAWGVFSKDLCAKGFKPAVLDTGWLPSLEGTRFEVERHKAYKNPNKEYKTDPTHLGVKSISVFGYEVKKKGGGGGGGVTGKGTEAKPNSKSESEPLKDTGVASAGIKEIAKIYSGKPQIKRSLLQAQFMTYLMKNDAAKKAVIDMKSRNELMNQTVKDDEWLANTAAEEGFVVDFEKQTVEFPA